MTRSEAEAAVAAAIDADKAAGNYWWRSDDMASVAFRRWSSYARRHKKNPSFEDRVVDLEKGLRNQYETDPIYSEPGEWLRLARLLAPLLDSRCP
jgi:hypothetical protein